MCTRTWKVKVQSIHCQNRSLSKYEPSTSSLYNWPKSSCFHSQRELAIYGVWENHVAPLSKFPRIFNGTLKFEFRVLIASSIVLFLLLQILSLMFNTKASQTSALLCQSRWCRCSSSFRPWSQLNSIKTFSWRVKVDWNVIFCSHLVLAQNLPQNLHTKIQEFFGFPAYSGAIPKV